VNKSTDLVEGFDSGGFASSGDKQEFLGDELRLLDRYELQTELVGTLQRTENHRHLAPRLAACHRSFRHWRCENNHDWAEAENSCSVRVCPHCSRRRSLILGGRLKNFTVGKTDLRYAVLAQRNSENLQEGIKELWASWTRLRRSVRWKRKVRGCIVALEVTRNVRDGTWHPHLNVLMEGEYFPFEELNKSWIEATKGHGQTSFIRAADAGTVRELMKYVTKTADLLADAPALDEFLSSVKGKRLVRTYGTFYGLPVDDEENPGVCCPDCAKQGFSNVSVVRLGFVAPLQITLDFEGILRVKRPPKKVLEELRAAAEFYPTLLPPRSPFAVQSALLRHWDALHKEFSRPLAA
jgi:hypothetical protein